MSWEVIRLTETQRADLTKIIDNSRLAARTRTLGRALMWLDFAKKGPGLTDRQVSYTLGLSLETISELKKLFNQDGLPAALDYRPPNGETLGGRSATGLNMDFEAKLIALARSEAPAGRNRWSVRLLAHQAVVNKLIPYVSHMTVHRLLKKNNLNLSS